jgi:hypothetical protein
MEVQETATQEGAPAVSQESAPVEEVQTEQPVEPVSEVSEPAQEQPAEEPKAIQELKRVRKRAQEAERKAAYYEGMIAAQQRSEPVVASAPTAVTPPRLEDFEDFDQFEAAKEQYLIQRAKQELQQSLQAEKAKAHQQQIDQKFSEKLAKAAEIDPEVVEIVQDPTLPVSAEMANLIKQSDLSIELLKHLNDNRQAAHRMMGMSPAQLGYELGRLEASIAAKAQSQKVEAPKKVSMAPEPIQTVTSNGPVEVDPDNMPIEEWMKRFGGPPKRR